MLRLASVLLAGIVTMGGWAVVTIKELPEYFVAGQRYTLEFQVRQHGRNLLNDLRPSLLISTPDGRLETIPAVSRSAEGTYAVTFSAPAAERVLLTLKSGFGNNQLRLYAQPIVAAGATRPAMSPSDRGQVLFVAKGCTTCHVNSDLAGGPDNNAVAVGPALGGRHLAREYVFQKVKHPASQIMPDLDLSDAEARAIAAFISGERAAATAGGGSR